MHAFNFVIEHGGETGLYVGSVPGWPGAYAQGATLDELQSNIQEVIEMLIEDGEPRIESGFVGIQIVRVA
ncbi:MAG: type II toxin-antitoxin system HicB family antitoxin [Candidatus Binatia bacterium]